MVKQIYNKSDGKPSLTYLNSEGVFEFDEFIYTEVTPPSDIYEPKYFDGDQWVGATREEWLESLPKDEPVNPSEIDFLNAQLISNDIEHNAKIKELQQDIANLATELLTIKGGTDNVSDS